MHCHNTNNRQHCHRKACKEGPQPHPDSTKNHSRYEDKQDSEAKCGMSRPSTCSEATCGTVQSDNCGCQENQYFRSYDDLKVKGEQCEDCKRNSYPNETGFVDNENCSNGTSQQSKYERKKRKNRRTLCPSGHRRESCLGHLDSPYKTMVCYKRPKSNTNCSTTTGNTATKNIMNIFKGFDSSRIKQAIKNVFENICMVYPDPCDSDEDIKTPKCETNGKKTKTCNVCQNDYDKSNCREDSDYSYEQNKCITKNKNGSYRDKPRTIHCHSPPRNDYSKSRRASNHCSDSSDSNELNHSQPPKSEKTSCNPQYEPASNEKQYFVPNYYQNPQQQENWSTAPGYNNMINSNTCVDHTQAHSPPDQYTTPNYYQDPSYPLQQQENWSANTGYNNAIHNGVYINHNTQVNSPPQQNNPPNVFTEPSQPVQDGNWPCNTGYNIRSTTCVDHAHVHLSPQQYDTPNHYKDPSSPTQQPENWSATPGYSKMIHSHTCAHHSHTHSPPQQYNPPNNYTTPSHPVQQHKSWAGNTEYNNNMFHSGTGNGYTQTPVHLPQYKTAATNTSVYGSVMIPPGAYINTAQCYCRQCQMMNTNMPYGNVIYMDPQQHPNGLDNAANSANMPNNEGKENIDNEGKEKRYTCSCKKGPDGHCECCCLPKKKGPGCVKDMDAYLRESISDEEGENKENDKSKPKKEKPPEKDTNKEGEAEKKEEEKPAEDNDKKKDKKKDKKDKKGKEDKKKKEKEDKKEGTEKVLSLYRLKTVDNDGHVKETVVEIIPSNSTEKTRNVEKRSEEVRNTEETKNAEETRNIEKIRNVEEDIVFKNIRDIAPKIFGDQIVIKSKRTPFRRLDKQPARQWTAPLVINGNPSKELKDLEKAKRNIRDKNKLPTKLIDLGKMKPNIKEKSKPHKESIDSEKIKPNIKDISKPPKESIDLRKIKQNIRDKSKLPTESNDLEKMKPNILKDKNKTAKESIDLEKIKSNIKIKSKIPKKLIDVEKLNIMDEIKLTKESIELGKTKSSIKNKSKPLVESIYLEKLKPNIKDTDKPPKGSVHLEKIKPNIKDDLKLPKESIELGKTKSNIKNKSKPPIESIYLEKIKPNMKDKDKPPKGSVDLEKIKPNINDKINLPKESNEEGKTKSNEKNENKPTIESIYLEKIKPNKTDINKAPKESVDLEEIKSNKDNVIATNANQTFSIHYLTTENNRTIVKPYSTREINYKTENKAEDLKGKLNGLLQQLRQVMKEDSRKFVTRNSREQLYQKEASFSYKSRNSIYDNTGSEQFFDTSSRLMYESEQSIATILQDTEQNNLTTQTEQSYIQNIIFLLLESYRGLMEADVSGKK